MFIEFRIYSIEMLQARTSIGVHKHIEILLTHIQAC